MDLIMTDDHDLYVTDSGDIELDVVVNDVKQIIQRIKTRLLWIADEWRLGPEMGFPWFEEVLVKKPNIDYIIQLIRNEITEVEGVSNVSVQLLSFNPATRRIKFEFRATVEDGSRIEEEVEFYG